MACEDHVFGLGLFCLPMAAAFLLLGFWCSQGSQLSWISNQAQGDKRGQVDGKDREHGGEQPELQHG